MSTEIAFVSGPNDEPMVSSRQVAEKFNKGHREVLRAAESVMLSIDAEFNRRNFAPITYSDSKNRSQPEILLTKDGFLLLAMGFTGPEAMKWKVRFIDAFNRLMGNVSELKLELARKEQVILQLQGKKPRKSPRLRVPNYNVFEGHEPIWELAPVDSLNDPMRSLGLLRKTIAQIDGLRKLAETYKKNLGIAES
jgi:Rha family phage regulatory protein